MKIYSIIIVVFFFIACSNQKVDTVQNDTEVVALFIIKY